MIKVTVGVVLFGTKYLEKSIPSLLNQDYPNIEYIFRDQEENIFSATEYLHKNFPALTKKIILEKGANLWHSGGHNAIINKMSGEIYFCCSNDILYPSDLISKMVKAFDDNPEYSFATCKSMRWILSEKYEKSEIIDTVGLGITEYHKFFDIGQGEIDNSQYNSQKRIFGASGAFLAIKKSALESIRFKDEYFDSRMHYKNDIDLSYRLNLVGNKCLFVPEIKVYHDRQVSTQSSKPVWVKQSSYLGERIILDKINLKRYPLRIIVKTALYHFLKRLYLFATTSKLWEAEKKFRNLKAELAEKKQQLKNGRIENVVTLMT